PPDTAPKNPSHDASDSSDDDDIGPALPGAPSATPRKKKKRRTLPSELQKEYLSALPSQPKYTKSLMHRDALTFAVMTPLTDFLITTSVDGVVKFWKKTAEVGGLEFVKAFRAHRGEVSAVGVSADGRCFASAGADKKVVIFDVVTFDLLAAIELEHTPKAVCWVHGRGASLPLLAVSNAVTPEIMIYDGRGENVRVLHKIDKLHRSPVHLMAYNYKYDCVVSCDEGGMVEYWCPSRPDRNFEKPDTVFEFKSGTGLFEFKKSKSVPTTLAISPTCTQFATFSHPDRRIRIFDFPSAKLHRTYDESLSTLSTIHTLSTSSSKLSDLEFNRRMAVETAFDLSSLSHSNLLFDESGHFLIYGSFTGIKILNTLTNQQLRLLGRDDNIRPMNLALYQGAPQKKQITTIEMAASSNPLLQESATRDPLIVATAHGKNRFYCYTSGPEVSKSERDIYNERPDVASNASAAKSGPQANNPSSLPQAVIMHTTMGDIHLRLFPEAAPKAVENFTTHAKNGYYNGTIFHRVIKKFMIQGGDPLGDGTGGESIWGKEFEDEISSLRHDKPYTLSMANAGPNTNASQFFITTEKTSWLDGKHTIFGRATQGLDVIHRIENARTYKDKPEEDIKIINISVL
ncbi:hypothetical protein EX30DRAFT_304067, partial [Ascodesmis nigricans]